MSDTEVSQHSEQEEEQEEEEENFTNLPLYDDNDESDVSEFQLPSESENERGRKKKSKTKRNSLPASHVLSPALAHRPAPKKSSLKKVSQGFSPERSESAEFERLEHPDITARRLENRKRKAPPKGPSKQSEIDKRRRLDPDNQYRLLLNSQIGDVISPKLGRREWKLKKTQIGSSIWRPSEKGKLHVALEKVGKYDIKAIAEFVGTKSQIEVKEYIDVFEAEIEKRNKSGRISAWKIEETNIAAAVEISTECEAILEEAADALAEKEGRRERRKEIKKWGHDAWLLSAENVSWIERDVKDKAGETVIKEVLPAAELLNLRNWLKISKGVFMNSADRPQQNWQEIIEPGEECGIYASAFADFHTLTVNLTRRIMAASMFAAESRLRADDSWYARTKGRLPKVTHVDVAQAVENMGLKLDSDEFWRTAPRRNHLEMVDDEVDDRKGGVAPMSHDLVEKVLSKRKKRRSRRRMRALANADRENISSGVSEYDSEESEGSHISVSSDDEEGQTTQEITRGALKMAPTTENDRYISLHRHRSPSPAFISPPPLKPFDEQTAEERYVAYVESVDHVEDVKAEVALWQMLQQDHPFEPEDMDVEVAEAAQLPRVVLKQKDPLQTDKWRDRAEYWAPWEHLEGLPAEENFRRRTKKNESDAAEVDATSSNGSTRKKAVRKAMKRVPKKAKPTEETIDISDGQSRATEELSELSEDSEDEEHVARVVKELVAGPNGDEEQESGRPGTEAPIPRHGDGSESEEEVELKTASKSRDEEHLDGDDEDINMDQPVVGPDFKPADNPQMDDEEDENEEEDESAIAPFQNLSSDALAAANDSRFFSDQDSILGTRRAAMERHLHSSPVLTQRGAKIKSQEERDARYASPVFTNTQLEDLLGTQQPLGSLPEMEMDVDESD